MVVTFVLRFIFVLVNLFELIFIIVRDDPFELIFSCYLLLTFGLRLLEELVFTFELIFICCCFSTGYLFSFAILPIARYLHLCNYVIEHLLRRHVDELKEDLYSHLLPSFILLHSCLLLIYEHPFELICLVLSQTY